MVFAQQTLLHLHTILTTFENKCATLKSSETSEDDALALVLLLGTIRRNSRFRRTFSTVR